MTFLLKSNPHHDSPQFLEQSWNDRFRAAYVAGEGSDCHCLERSNAIPFVGSPSQLMDLHVCFICIGSLPEQDQNTLW